MPSVFLSHSSQDKPFVRELAESLEKGGIEVWFDGADIAYGDSIAGAIEQGLDADFVLLVLSPDSVQSAWVNKEVSASVGRERPKLLLALCRDCRMPRLLSDEKRFDLRTNRPQGFREILGYLHTQQPSKPTHYNRLPPPPPLFIGREPELAALRERLGQPNSVAYVSGLAGRGKTTLALQFAHLHQTDFESVYWLPCQSSSLASIASDLERLLELKLNLDLPNTLRELKHVCSGKRCLLVLDNVEEESSGELIPGGAASVLITTRRTNLAFLQSHQPLPLPLFSEQQCFELFRQQLGAAAVQRQEALCQRLFERLGYLPFAISVSAALIRHDVRYTIASVANDPPKDVTALIRQAIEALTPATRSLLAAMSACAPQGFALDLAARIADQEEAASLDALQELMERSLAEELDRDDRRYRLHALVREAAGGKHLAPKHAEAVKRRFENWERDWARCEKDLPDLLLALDGDSQALANRGFRLGYRIGRLAEAFEISERRRRAADAAGNQEALQAWLGNQALILKAWGRLDEALALHKKEEEICLQLGDQDGLQASYGNQALILKAWGRLDEALALHKKQEEICLQLGNQDDLQRSYGNQALILQDWGRLDEALALHKKEEEICLQLGNQDSLQRSYGNQALILKAWGRLDEALALHKKQEEICLQLGNQDSLQASYGNQALILQARGRLDEALALHKKEEAICLQLGNQDGLQASYGNQALILQDWGRLDEALALHKKKEAICLQLGNQDSLQRSYGNQALILKAWGRLDEALALHKKEEAICLQLGNQSGLAYCCWNWGLLERDRQNLPAAGEKLSAALTLFQQLRMPVERDEVQADLDALPTRKARSTQRTRRSASN